MEDRLKTGLDIVAKLCFRDKTEGKERQLCRRFWFVGYRKPTYHLFSIKVAVQ
jgi:hypothetical protein